MYVTTICNPNQNALTIQAQNGKDSLSNKSRQKQDKGKLTFSFTSSSASTNSPSSGLSFRLLTTVDGSSHAFFIDLKPKNIRRATAAYSPMGKAVKVCHLSRYRITGVLGELACFIFKYRKTNEQRKTIHITIPLHQLTSKFI